MMKSTNLLFPTSALFLLLLVLPAFHAEIQCSEVIQELAPCVMFLSSGIGFPSPACCDGATNLASAASTMADRQAACTCILPAAQKIQASEAAVEALANSCGINLPFTLSYNVDCSKIS